MKEIYLDNAATTQVSPASLEKAVYAMEKAYGNPSSLHKKGLEAQLLLEHAREQVAKALGCLPEEITFTSGATEANNMALFGGAHLRRRKGKTIVTTAVEHSSVLEPLARLEQEGYQIRKILPRADGSLDVDALVAAVDADTALVSAMLVNSELGSISEIGEAVRRVKRKNQEVLFHTDAVQGFGKIPFTVRSLGVDFLSLSGHKLHAPKGVGALYVKKGIRLPSRTFGGGQEKDLRPGTEALPAIAALGVAAEEAQLHLEENRHTVEALFTYFVNNLQKQQDLCSNSAPLGTLYIQNISMPGYRSEIVLHYLAERGIYLSSGSACSKGATSHVLKALGLPDQRVDSALRISFSKYNTIQEIDALFAALEQARHDVIRSN